MSIKTVNQCLVLFASCVERGGYGQRQEDTLSARPGQQAPERGEGSIRATPRLDPSARIAANSAFSLSWHSWVRRLVKAAVNLVSRATSWRSSVIRTRGISALIFSASTLAALGSSARTGVIDSLSPTSMTPSIFPLVKRCAKRFNRQSNSRARPVIHSLAVAGDVLPNLLPVRDTPSRRSASRTSRRGWRGGLSYDAQDLVQLRRDHAKSPGRQQLIQRRLLCCVG